MLVFRTANREHAVKKKYSTRRGTYGAQWRAECVIQILSSGHPRAQLNSIRVAAAGKSAIVLAVQSRVPSPRVGSPEAAEQRDSAIQSCLRPTSPTATPILSA